VLACDKSPDDAEPFSAERRDGKGKQMTAATPEALRSMVLRDQFGHRISREAAQ
jgi:hypothetical protein